MTKVESMRIEILLKDLRKKKRIQFRTISQANGNIKFTFELYKKNEKEPTISVLVRIAQALNVKIDELYKIIQQHKLSAIFIFVKENGRFIKYPPQWIRNKLNYFQKLRNII